MEKRQAEARGKAAKIVEDGKATAAVLTQMIDAWKAAGPNARDIFLMQKLQSVMSSLVETIQSVRVDRVAYLPASARVTQGIQLVEQMKAAFGVDLAKVVERLGAPGKTTTSGS
jgi:flotillin